MGYTPPYLDVRKSSATLTKVYGLGTVTGDDIIYYANYVDDMPNLQLYGNSVCYLAVPANMYWQFFWGAIAALKLSHPAAGTDLIIESLVNNDDIYMKTTGSGVLKFGTYTAGAATDSTGYITIKDAAGNTRKLMVQA